MPTPAPLPPRPARRRLRVVVATAVLAVAGAAGVAPSADAHPWAVGSTAVALGDSFASGEGLAPYEEGTDTTTNQCHRSDLAYPELLTEGRPRAVRRVHSVACSGAVTGALVADLPDRSDEPAQLTALRRQTRTVTLTVGGNDIGFAPVLQACIYTPIVPLQGAVTGRPGCQDAPGLDAAVTAATAGLAGTGPTGRGQLSMAQVLLQVHQRSPRARIYVTGYPRLLGLTGLTPTLGCQVGQVPLVVQNQPFLAPLYVSEPDVRWIRSKVDALNAAIQAGVAQARQAGVRATYVDVADDFAGHAVCDTGRPWLNGVVLAPGTTPSLATATFHPTARGQRAYAAAVAEAIRPRHPRS